MRTVPSELTLACLSPEVPANDTMGALLEAYIETAGRLHSCKVRHEALTDFLHAEVKP